MKNILNKKLIQRYSRQIILKDVGPIGQKKIMNSKVLVVGAGGLGCPVIDYLSRAGVGNIGIVDNDKVNISNIHRQSLYNSKDVGEFKVNSVKEKIKLINPQVKIKTFKERDETFKLRIIEEIPEEGLINLYKHEEYIDMCRGPHVPNTRHLRHYKLLKLSGSYWRGNSENESLQRIYGTAWAKEKELNDYLRRIEEAEKRDHRKLGKKHSLFHIQEESPGMIFWHPNGLSLIHI